MMHLEGAASAFFPGQAPGAWNLPFPLSVSCSTQVSGKKQSALKGPYTTM